MSEIRFNRTELLVGTETFNAIADAKVIIFGVGGVGSWCAETLVRTGVTRLTIVDCDTVDPTNINRQLPALTSTVGRPKTEVLSQRLLDINPDAEIIAINKFYNESTADEFHLADYDFVIDAIDSLKDKALLLLRASETPKNTTLLSSMGAALKMDPSKIEVAEFWKVKGCPLAAALRNRFKRTGEYPKKKFKCVFSPEIFRNRGEQGLSRDSQENPDGVDWSKKKAVINGSVMHTTAIFGLTLGGLVIQKLIK